MKQSAFTKAQKRCFYKYINRPEATARVKKLLHPSLQFPNISRFIPERAALSALSAIKIFTINFLCGFLIMAISLQIYQVAQQMQQVKQIQQYREHIQSEIGYWQKITNSYQGYRDGYKELSYLEQQIGDIKQAALYQQKVLLLDPGYRETSPIPAGESSQEKLTRTLQAVP